MHKMAHMPTLRSTICDSYIDQSVVVGSERKASRNKNGIRGPVIKFWQLLCCHTSCGSQGEEGKVCRDRVQLSDSNNNLGSSYMIGM